MTTSIAKYIEGLLYEYESVIPVDLVHTVDQLLVFMKNSLGSAPLTERQKWVKSLYHKFHHLSSCERVFEAIDKL